MSMHLDGTPSDDLPEVLATGGGAKDFAFLSVSARDPPGRGAAYIEWDRISGDRELFSAWMEDNVLTGSADDFAAKVEGLRK